MFLPEAVRFNIPKSAVGSLIDGNIESVSEIPTVRGILRSTPEQSPAITHCHHIPHILRCCKTETCNK